MRDRLWLALAGVLVLALCLALVGTIGVAIVRPWSHCYHNEKVLRAGTEHYFSGGYIHLATASTADIVVDGDDSGAVLTRVGDRISYCEEWPFYSGQVFDFYNDSANLAAKIPGLPGKVATVHRSADV
jgi:hypothetical protein